MKKLLTLIIIALVFVCCSDQSFSYNAQCNQYQMINSNVKWVTYKIDSTHFLCIPSYEADEGAVPMILKVEE